jgi:hypothetical protein
MKPSGSLLEMAFICMTTCAIRLRVSGTIRPDFSASGINEAGEI